jgi:hypothetical protein
VASDASAARTRSGDISDAPCRSSASAKTVQVVLAAAEYDLDHGHREEDHGESGDDRGEHRVADPEPGDHEVRSGGGK